jgi:hypothetical protein
MLIAIYAFAAKLKTLCLMRSDSIPGHGMASAGETYPIPIDVDEPATVQLSVQGVKQGAIKAEHEPLFVGILCD